MDSKTVLNIVAVGASYASLFLFSLRLSNRASRFSKLTGDGRPLVQVHGANLRVGARPTYSADERILANGNVIDGAALVDESVLTGESAPVLRDSRVGHHQVLEGSRVVSGQITVETTQVSQTTARFSVDHAFAPLRSAGGMFWLSRLRTELYVVGAVAFLLVFLTISSTSTHSLPAAIISVFAFSLPFLVGLRFMTLLYTAALDRLFHRHLTVSTLQTFDRGAEVTHLIEPRASAPPAHLMEEAVVDCIPVEGASRDTLLKAAQWTALIDDQPESRALMLFLKRQPGFRPVDLKSVTAQFLPAQSDSCDLRGVIIYNPDGEDAMRSIMLGSLDGIKKHIEGLGHHLPASLEERYVALSSEDDRCLLLADGSKVIGLIGLTRLVKTSNQTPDPGWAAAGVTRLSGVDLRERSTLLAQVNSLAGGSPAILIESEDDLKLAGLADLTVANSLEGDDVLSQADVVSLTRGQTNLLRFFVTAREREFIEMRINAVLKFVLFFLAAGLAIESFVPIPVAALAMMVSLAILVRTGLSIDRFHESKLKMTKDLK